VGEQVESLPVEGKCPVADRPFFSSKRRLRFKTHKNLERKKYGHGSLRRQISRIISVDDQQEFIGLELNGEMNVAPMQKTRSLPLAKIRLHFQIHTSRGNTKFLVLDTDETRSWRGPAAT
jgi:hypothetical protein